MSGPRRTLLLLDTPGGDLAPLEAAFRAALGGAGTLRTVTSADALEAELASESAPDLVVLDLVLGDGAQGGAAVLARIRQRHAELPVVAVAERGNVRLAGDAVASGATDFLVRGGRLKERVATLMGKVTTLLDLREKNRRLRALLADQGRFHIVGDSPQIRAVVAQVGRVGAIPRPVLVTGERGTGKELVARAIHAAASRRGSAPFVVVNCAAFPDTLLESELFGHEKGAFTGADRRAVGKFELASGGTLFLDEIGHMSAAFQRKILRVVEYGVFTPVGGAREAQVDTRIVGATNADLPALLRSGHFLQDLYDRLSFEVLAVPPLREREGDVELLAHHFLASFLREVPALGRKSFVPEALDALRRYPFPGNVRELKNVVERAAYRDRTQEIGLDDLGPLDGSPAEAGAVAGGFEARVEAFKRQLVRDALRAAGGNQAKAAPLLGLSYHQFRYYLQKYAADT